jgi:hypothetical protein
MRNRNGRMNYIYMALAGILCSLMPVGASATAKDKDDDGIKYWQSSQLSYVLRSNFMALGDRLQKAGRERITITGTLVNSSGSNPVKVVMERGGKVRVDQSSKSIIFDGKSSSSNLSANDKDLLESFSDDLPDTLIEAAALGNGFRFIGQRFLDPKGGSCDYYDAATPAKVNPKSTPQIKRYCFDSNTKLLSWVQHQSGNGKNVSTIETHFSDWTIIQGQAVAGTVSRIQDGTPVFTLKVQEVDISRSANDNLFKP